MSNNKRIKTYRIPSNRLQGYDYGTNGCYFITICTKNRVHYFGEIVDEIDGMVKTEFGKIAEKYWLEIPTHFPFVILDQFVIMPNHIHGLLFFNSQHFCRDAIYRVSSDEKNASSIPLSIPPSTTPSTTPSIPLSTTPSFPQSFPQSFPPPFPPPGECRDAINRVSTTTPTGGITGMNNPMLHHNLGHVLRWFKGRVSFECHSYSHFAWQERYHDRIIRNLTELNNVRAYILNNPQKWNEDEFNKKHLKPSSP